MATPVNMPQVGQDIEIARINEWHVSVGDKVSEGDILATVESDKASFEVEAPTGGVVLQLLYRAGDEAPVLRPIAYIGQENEIGKNEEQLSIVLEEKKTTVSETEKTNNTENKAKRLFISPSARRVARENNINLKEFADSGLNTRITKQDVINLLEHRKTLRKVTPLAQKIGEDAGIKTQSIEGSGFNKRVLKKDVISLLGVPKSRIIDAAPEDKVVVFNKTRKRIAEKLTFSKHTIPHFYLFSDIDITRTLKWKDNISSMVGSDVSVNDIIIKATADALAEHPELNSYVDDEKMVIKPDINIGVAVSTPEGSLVPVIHNANKLNLNEIHEISLKNAENAKRGIVQIKYQGTFTISNLGMFGVGKFQPIINPPECAILSVGAIEKKVVPNNGEIKIADILTLGLACDHRAVDGVKAAQFLRRIKEIIENFGN